MTDHLPDCPEVDPKWGSWCICDRLRACEQRVTVLWQQKAQAMEDRGFARGLNCARDAVAATYDSLNYEHTFNPECECVWCEDGALLLAAIDAQRGAE